MAWHSGRDFADRVEKAVSAKDRALRDAINKIAQEVEPDIRDAFIEAVERVRRGADVSSITEALKRGDVEAAVAALELDALLARLRGMVESLTEVYLRGGATMAEAIASGYTGRPIEFRFDTYSDSVVQFVRSYQFDLVQNIDRDTRDAVRAVMSEGYRAQLAPSAMARELRDAVGLNERQGRALSNFKRALEKGDAAMATQRALGVRLEQRVRRTIRDGGRKEQIAELVEAYRQRLIRQRAEAIARTESIRMLNAGQHEALRQAVGDGALNGNTLKRYWLVADDERTCPVCTGIARSNRDGVGVEEPFRSSNGPIMNPPAHPNCRCSIFLRQSSGNRLLDQLNPAPRLVDAANGGKRFETLAESYRRQRVGGPLRRGRARRR